MKRLSKQLFSAMVLVSVGFPVSAEIEEIVVVARKKEESQLEVPIAMSVLDGQFFDDTGINTIADMVRFVPGLDLTPLNTSRATGPKIRGISTFSFSDGFESSVATVIDGVVMGREAQGFFDLYDIETVEVIKGPQGTLFGKNASAGVINVRTKRPEFQFGGGGDIAYGRFNEVLARGGITGGLIEDKLAFRLSGSWNTHDGKLDNRLPGEDDVNDKDTWSMRGKLLFTPTDNLEALVIADYVTEENHCCLSTYRVAGGATPAVAFALNTPVQQLPDALNALGITASDSNRDVAVTKDRILQESQAWGISAQIDYDFSWGTLTSITAFRDWEIDEFNEGDTLTTSDVNNFNGTVSDSTQFTQEFRITGEINNQIDYVAGLYYFEQDLYALGRVQIELTLPFPPFFNVVTTSERTVDTRSTAAFAEFTFNVTDKLSFVLGGRYTNEDIEATYQRLGIPISPGPFTGTFFGPNFSGVQDVDDTDFSGRAIARYFLSDDAMIYGTWSRGYKGPGIDVAVSARIDQVAEPGGLPVLEPEVPTLWEVGSKFLLLEDSLMLNLTAFREEIEDLQAIAPTLAGTRNISIDDVLSQGIELELMYQPSDALSFSASFTYLDVSIEKFAGNPALEGDDYRDVPNWAYSVSADYNFPINDSGYLGFVRLEATGQGEKNTSLTGDDDFDVDSYTLVNLRAGFTSPSQRYSVTVMADNLLDENYPHYLFTPAYGTLDGATRAQFLGDELTYSVRFGMKF